MSAAEKLSLEGDWLTEEEAALYCRVSLSQFKVKVQDYGIAPRRFMGKKVYEKAALYAAIHGAEAWRGSRCIGATGALTSTGARAANDSAAPLANLRPVRLRRSAPRRKPN